MKFSVWKSLTEANERSAVTIFSRTRLNFPTELEFLYNFVIDCCFVSQLVIEIHTLISEFFARSHFLDTFMATLPHAYIVFVTIAVNIQMLNE